MYMYCGKADNTLCKLGTIAVHIINSILINTRLFPIISHLCMWKQRNNFLKSSRTFCFLFPLEITEAFSQQTSNEDAHFRICLKHVDNNISTTQHIVNINLTQIQWYYKAYFKIPAWTGATWEVVVWANVKFKKSTGPKYNITIPKTVCSPGCPSPHHIICITFTWLDPEAWAPLEAVC